MSWPPRLIMLPIGFVGLVAAIVVLPEWVGVAVAGGLVVVGVSVIPALLIRDKLRTRALAPVAADLGLTYRGDGGGNPKWLNGFGVTTADGTSEFSNLMMGDVQGVAVVIVQCRSNVGSANRRMYCDSTIAGFRSPDLDLPVFRLRPTGSYNALVGRAMPGMEKVEMPGQHQFLKRYVVQGPDDAAVRKLFADDVIRALTSVKGLWIEGFEDRLLVYPYREKVKPRKIRSFLDEASHVLDVFRDGTCRSTRHPC